MFYTRPLYFALKKELESRKIIVLTGLRHVGKTTLLNKIFSEIKSANKVFLDLENPLYRKVFEEDNYDNIWNNLSAFGINQNQKAYIFLDEIQNQPEVSRAVKYLFDHHHVKFYLTGSSSFYLKNLFPESMANRKLIYELFPLTFAEFLIFKNVARSARKSFKEKADQKNKIQHGKLIGLYKEFMEFGGFPEVVLEPNVDRKKQLLEEVFTAYFEKDVKNLADFKDLTKIRDLILLLANRVGSKMEISKLAAELSLSRETIYNYLQFLEKSYLINLLSKHTGSVEREIAGGKKVYFADTGLVNYLGKISEGQIFENSVWQNFAPHYKKVNYFEKETGSEIDFVLNGKTGIEVKITAAPRDLATLRLRLKSARLKEGYVLSMNFSSLAQVVLAIDL